MIGLSIAVVSLLPPSSDTSFHCGSAIFSYSSSNLALLQNFITFGFVPVNSLFISFTSLCFQDFPSISPGAIKAEFVDIPSLLCTN